MKATIQSVRYLVCPSCGQRSSSIDHLKTGATFGPWPCHNPECTVQIAGTITDDGADIETRPKSGRRMVALLKFRDLYLVLDDEIDGDHMDYFYHSHQCPTNLLKRVDMVVDATGSDPHGTMRFVASIPWSKETEERLEGTGSLQELFLLFETDGQPPPSDWPEENGGVLPIIVEARREWNKDKAPKA